MMQYEAMFLFDPTFGASYENCEGEIRRLIVDRAGGEIEFCRKWDERRLAYKVKGRKRGVYVLVYFKAPPEKISPLERDAELNENILRVLVLTANGMTAELMEKAASSRGEEPGDELLVEEDGRDNRRPRFDRGEREDRGDRGGRMAGAGRGPRNDSYGPA